MECCGNIDYISNMPSEIIEKILTYLLPREAVRTSVLARSWRYRWTSMADVNFVYNNGGWGTVTEFVKGVNGFLRLHQGPIHKFSIRCTSLTVPVRHIIHWWMSLVLKPDLEELEMIGGDDDFPSHLLFDCQKLTHLKLQGCKLLHISPTFEGFLNLKILELSYEMVDRKIGMLISKCPLLESLALYSYKSSNDLITIFAPKVKYFKLQGEFQDICLENANVLVDMFIGLHCNKGQCNVIKLLSGAPNLQRLTINNFTKSFKPGLYGEGLSTTFNYLKIMKLARVNFHEIEGIPALLELMTSAPNLEKLVIIPRYSPQSKTKVKSSSLQKEYTQGNGFMKLRVIEMLDIYSAAHEIEFAALILLNSPILEKMELRSARMNNVVIQRMHKKLSKLPRISAQAEVEVTFHPDSRRDSFRYEP